MTASDPTKLSAIAIVQAIARGDLKAETVMAAHLERIAARDDAVRAWAFLDRDGALKKAKALDKGPIRGPLHGVPIAIKDITDTYDLPTEYGSPIYAGYRPKVDSPPVAMARAAGAIIVGKTVTTEFANRHPGATRNPHNPNHTPGGSSQGSPAAVADFQAVLGTGTQTAGSVIRPASFCGVVGYKPSFGTIATAGTKMEAWSLDTIGMFARSVADIALYRAVMTAAAPRTPDPTFQASPRIALMRTPYWGEVSEAGKAALDTAAETLGKAGAVVVDLDFPDVARDILDTHRTVMLFEVARTLADEAIRFAPKLSPVMRAEILPDAQAISYDAYADAQDRAIAQRAAFDALFDQYDGILTLPADGEAPVGLGWTGRPMFNAPWTLLGTPAITLPWAKGPTGLPIGVQLIGRMRKDWQLLHLAAWAEKQLAAATGA